MDKNTQSAETPQGSDAAGLEEVRYVLSAAATDEVRAKVMPRLTSGEEKRSGYLPIIEGYAAIYNTPADSGMGFEEEVLPGAFTESLRNKDDVVACWEHDWNHPYARLSAGEPGPDGDLEPGVLTLEDRDVGLYFRFRPVDTVDGRNMVEMVRRKVVKQCSFRFRMHGRGGEEWTRNKSGGRLRRLRRVKLRDVALTMDPFYPNTSVQVARDPNGEEARSLMAAMRERMPADDAGPGAGDAGNTSNTGGDMREQVEDLLLEIKFLRNSVT